MDLKISQFPFLSIANSNAILPVIQSGVNYVIAVSSLFSNNYNISNTGTAVFSSVNISNSYGTSEVAASPLVTILSAINSQIIIAKNYFDETNVILPTGSLSALSWVLPKASASRVGQIKTFYSSQNITTLSVSISGGGTLMGVPLTTASSNESYSYQCIRTNGTWLRLA